MFYFVSFVQHMKSTNSATWYAVFMTSVILVGGVLIRKIGTTLSDEKSIANMERILYSTKNE